MEQADAPHALNAVIRPARSDEAPLLSALAQASKAHWPYPPAVLDRWRDDLTIAPQLIATDLVFVCELAGELAGFYSLAPHADGDPTLWTLRDLWVRPPSIANGIGTALLAHACACAARHGVTMLATDADPYAEAFYLARGARRVGAVAAPIDSEPDRVRPQLRLATAVQET